MQDYSEIIQSLKDFMARTERKQSEICRTMDVSSSVLSQFLAGQYQGDNDGVAEKIKKYLTQEAAKAYQPENPPFVMTTAAKEVFFAAGYAQRKNGIALVYGSAGVGKTIAVQEYIKQSVGVVYSVIREGDSRTKAACARILKALNKKAAGTEASLLDEIIDTIGFTNRLLIIDEAQHLSIKAIDSLRSLNDEGKIPILLVGNTGIYNIMTEESGLDQIFSRICPKREIKDKPHISDIQLVFEPYSLSSKCIEALYTIACQKGGLRHAVNVYQMAVSLAASMNEPFNEKYLISGQKHADSRRK